jgi:hypothetical protein
MFKFTYLDSKIGKKKLHLTKKLFYHCSDDISKICDPWEAGEMFGLMLSVSTKDCPHCLPDCETTIYRAKVDKIIECKSALRNLHFGR